MTEAELWKLIAQPVIFAITMLAFLKASWKVRTLVAIASAGYGLAMGLLILQIDRLGAPWWLGWLFAASCAASLAWKTLQHRKRMASDR